MAPAAPSISELAIIGDTRTAALLGPGGTVEWMCLPRFDREPVFGRLVGGEDAGEFTIAPTGDRWAVAERRYRPDSAVLETTWSVGSGQLVLTEAMLPELGGRLLPQSLFVRRLVAHGAPTEVTITFRPRSRVDGRDRLVRTEPAMLVATWGPLAVGLTADIGETVPIDEPVTVSVDPARPVVLAMSVGEAEPIVRVDPSLAAELLEEADQWWRQWSEGIGEGSHLRDAQVRSAITLRLLSYSPSGAPVAAPTTSLPEEIGGTRNWDYRFAWARDASIGSSAFLRLGRTREAENFLYWLMHAGRLARPNLAAMFTLDGTPVPDETIVEGWPGYRDSPPVHVGNSAAGQHQLDAYGWVIDAVWNHREAGGEIFGELWRMAAGLTDVVADRWSEPDAGIWEVRGPERHYVHSKLMAWLALDRAVRMAPDHRTRAKRRERWARQRDLLAEELRSEGFDSNAGRYRRAYGADDLDAAVLLLPVVGFDEPDSPAVHTTIDAIGRELSAGGPLLYRYPPGTDGLEGGEGAFLVCSFWWAQALATTGRIDEAGELLDELVGVATPLGLFGEEIDPDSGEYLGNFPLAFSHATFLQAAAALEEAERLNGSG